MDDLTNVDWQFMAQQQETMQDLAMMNLGRQFNGDRKLDLELLQALLDKPLVRPGPRTASHGGHYGRPARGRTR